MNKIYENIASSDSIYPSKNSFYEFGKVEIVKEFEGWKRYLSPKQPEGTN